MEFKDLPIPTDERENLSAFTLLLRKASENLGHDLRVEVVGGVKHKPWPRKDIDILCTLEDLKGKLTGTELEKATQELNKLKELVESAVLGSDNYSITKIKQPYSDHEFEDPNILAFRGVIEVKPKKGTVFEIIGGLT